MIEDVLGLIETHPQAASELTTLILVGVSLLAVMVIALFNSRRVGGLKVDTRLGSVELDMDPSQTMADDGQPPANPPPHYQPAPMELPEDALDPYEDLEELPTDPDSTCDPAPAPWCD